MGVIKIVAVMIIFCGFLMGFLPDDFSKYAFECVTVFAVCIYVLNTASSGFCSFSSDCVTEYTAVTDYAEYVRCSQRKLFDDIAAGEKAYETD